MGIAADKLKKIQLGFMMDHPGFGILSTKLQVKEDPTCETGYTDGRVLGVNPDFFNSLTTAEQKFFYVHELLHNAYNHFARRGHRDFERWNIACDHAINLFAIEAGFQAIDRRNFKCLMDVKYKNMAAEKIYSLLPEEKPNKSSKQWNIGEIRDAKPSDENGNGGSSIEDLTQEWKITAIQAAKAQKQFGNTCGFWESIIDAITATKLGFEEYLEKFMAMTGRNDYTWSQFNSRYASIGIHFPKLRSKELGKVVIAIDTSGSISDKLVAEFLGKVMLLRHQYPCTITLMCCDTKVHFKETFGPYEHLEVKIKGRGGTSFIPVFDEVAKDSDCPVCLIYFTDCCGEFPKDEPHFPVLWTNYGDKTFTPPFGDIVSFELES